MKSLHLVLALAAMGFAACDNRNTGDRDPAPNSPEDSQVTHPLSAGKPETNSTPAQP